MVLEHRRGKFMQLTDLFLNRTILADTPWRLDCLGSIAVIIPRNMLLNVLEFTHNESC